MIEQTQADIFAQTWLDAWNRHDLEAILAHYADEVEFVSPMVVQHVGEPLGSIRGKPALRAYFAKGLAEYPDLRFRLEKTLPGVHSVTVYYHSVSDLLAAEVMEFDDRQRVFRVLAHYTPRS